MHNFNLLTMLVLACGFRKQWSKRS